MVHCPICSRPERAYRTTSAYTVTAQDIGGFDGDSNKCTEAFSEILEMLSSPNDNARKILDKYLPTARDFVLDLIKETR